DPNGTLAKDGNQEIWTYQFTAPDTADLSSGAEIPLQDLTTGTFRRITDTPASIAPMAGSATRSPVVADDNRDASISDDGKIVAFVSTRNLVGGGNADGNPEVFLVNVSNPTFTFIQVTNTTDKFTNGFLTNPIFNENPSLSGNGSVLAFVSNANLAGANDDGGGVGNAEIYLANFNGTAVSGLRQITKTKDGAANPSPSPNASPAPTPIPDTFATANIFSRGRRLSRDGSFIAFESLANDPK